jgi:hypothetical protein
MARARRSAARPTSPPRPEPAPAIATSDDELARLEADVATRFPEPPPPPPPPGASAGAGADPADEVAEGLELVGEHPELLDEFSDQDFAEIWELAFGLVADWRGPHWELPARSSLRLGKWSSRVVRRHPELLQWLAKNAPDLILGLLLVIEVGRRIGRDRQARRLAAPPPAASTPPVEPPTDQAAV